MGAYNNATGYNRYTVSCTRSRMHYISTWLLFIQTGRYCLPSCHVKQNLGAYFLSNTCHQTTGKYTYNNTQHTHSKWHHSDNYQGGVKSSRKHYYNCTYYNWNTSLLYLHDDTLTDSERRTSIGCSVSYLSEVMHRPIHSAMDNIINT